MDLINTLNESVKDFYNLSAYKPDIFDEVCNDFDNWAISALNLVNNYKNSYLNL